MSDITRRCRVCIYSIKFDSHGTSVWICFIKCLCFHILNSIFPYVIMSFQIYLFHELISASNLTSLIFPLKQFLFGQYYHLYSFSNHLLTHFHIGRTIIILYHMFLKYMLILVFLGSTTETILLVIVLPISCFSWINM